MPITNQFAKERQEIFNTLSYRYNSSTPAYASNDYDKAVKIFIADLKDNLSSEDNWFVATKQRLNILADHRLGIISRYETLKNGENDVHVYLRDARVREANVSIDPTTPDFENWAIMGLSYFQALYQLVDLQIGFGMAETIKETAQWFLEKIASQENPQAFLYAVIEEVLVPEVQKVLEINDQEKAKKKLNVLKDFGNLDEPPCCLVTLFSEAKDRKVKNLAEIDVPIYQLTASQRQDYIDVSMSEESKNSPPAWYLAIKDEQTRLMVLHYIPQILQGRQIPTQMIDLLPGIRNAGEERIYALGENGDPPKQKMKTFHAGSMGQDTKAGEEENIRLTVENMKQLQSLTGAKKVLVNSLISPCLPNALSDFGNETRLYNVQEEAAKRINANSELEFSVVYANTPLEFTRAFLTADFTIENEVWEAAKGQLTAYTGQEWKNIESAIKNAIGRYPDGIPLEQAKELVKSSSPHDDPFLTEILPMLFQHMVELERLRTSSESNWTFGLQKNGQRVAKYKQILGLINEWEEWKNCDPETILISGCKSGKDREGLLAILIMLEIAAYELTTKSSQLYKMDCQEDTMNDSALIQKCEGGDEVILSYVAQKVVEATHITTRAGLQGGSEGAKGIKNEGLVLPSWLGELAHEIAQETAYSNKKVKKPNISKEERQFVRKEVKKDVGEFTTRETLHGTNDHNLNDSFFGHKHEHTKRQPNDGVSNEKKEESAAYPDAFSQKDLFNQSL